VYRYDATVDPPAAYVPVQVTNPDTGASMRLSAKIDSGAAILLPTYSVTFEVESYTVQDVEVAVSPGKDVLLGRDVLNHFHPQRQRPHL